jgi:hypothetical protein
VGVVAIPCSMGLLIKITIKGSVKISKKTLKHTHSGTHNSDTSNKNCGASKKNRKKVSTGQKEECKSTHAPFSIVNI